MAGNQYQPDPRQSLFLANYLDPGSETFSNAYKSALKAGYSEEYSSVILSQDLDWLSEKLKDEDMVQRAEKALLEALNYVTVNEEGKVDASVAKIKQDTAKFISERLKKEKYSARQEVTGKDGKDLPTPIINLNGLLGNNSSTEDSSTG